jgi:hypothetical protein
MPLTALQTQAVDAFAKVLSGVDDALQDDRRDSQLELEKLVAAGWLLVDAIDHAEDPKRGDR